MKLEKFRVVNNKRGRATCLCTFDVNLGPITVKDFEIVKVDGGKTFLGVPGRRYKDQTDKWISFNHIWFNGERGGELQNQIFDAAREEYLRRNNAPAEVSPVASDDPFGGGDGGSSDDGFGW